jgi:hypothetical protein
MAAHSAAFTSPDLNDYAVYSTVLANIPDRQERLLIAQESINAPEGSLRLTSCSGLSAETKAQIEEVTRANRDLRSIPAELESGKLRVSRPHVVLTSKQTDEWRRTRFQPKVPTDPRTEVVDSFPESRLIELSGVLYNRTRALALVYISNICGNLCGSAQWELLAKKGDNWEVTPIGRCGGVIY